MSNISGDKVFRFRKSVITVRKDGIVQIASHENMSIDENDFREGLQFLHKKYKGKKFPVLFIPGENSEVTSEFRKIASSELADQLAIADALVVESLPHRMVGNFYIKFNKPSRPTKVFSNRQEAIKWLRSQMQ